MKIVLRTVIIWAALVPAWPGLAQESDQVVIPRGEVVERLAAASDTTQHYALYVPTSYSTDDPGPVMFLMDPRGRALLPMELFQEAAERYGYLVLSSHDTLSDEETAFAVNQRALNAMIQDAQLRFTVDTRRMVLIGFSGTAHFAWYAANELDGFVAGLVAVGDGMPPHLEPVQKATAMRRPFAYFGMAGRADFNYDNTWRRDRVLDESPIPHRFAEFEGPHRWMPKELAEEAIDWLELQAMQDGLAQRSPQWIREMFTSRLARARQLETTGNPALAWRQYREIIQDFDGLISGGDHLDSLRSVARDLGLSSEVRRSERLGLERSDAFDDYRRTVYAFLEEYGQTSPVISFEEAIKRLEIDQLIAARSDPDAAAAAFASRKLATVFAQTAFYHPRTYLASEDYERAAGLLRIALRISPDDSSLAERLRQARTELGRVNTP